MGRFNFSNADDDNSLNHLPNYLKEIIYAIEFIKIYEPSCLLMEDELWILKLRQIIYETKNSKNINEYERLKLNELIQLLDKTNFKNNIASLLATKKGVINYIQDIIFDTPGFFPDFIPSIYSEQEKILEKKIQIELSKKESFSNYWEEVLNDKNLIDSKLFFFIIINTFGIEGSINSIVEGLEKEEVEISDLASINIDSYYNKSELENDDNESLTANEKQKKIEDIETRIFENLRMIKKIHNNYDISYIIDFIRYIFRDPDECEDEIFQ